MQEGVWYEPPSVSSKTLPWETVDEDGAERPTAIVQETISDVIADTTHVWSHVRERVFEVTNDALAETGRQYSKSLNDGGKVARDTVRAIRNGWTTTWSFMKQPVWVPGRRNTPKQYSRGALFALDIVRFGGTFASIFVLLFVTLNFQSFWAIANSYVEPLAQVTGGTVEIDKELSEKLRNIPSLAVAGEQNNGMIDFLPPVGPPENRLIIPKLNINVPIVIPSSAALMAEDWALLEEDIQTSLQDGVVHYPGTARPGQAGNFFVTGHSSYFPWAPGEYKSVFARLHNLDVGDEYWVFYGGDRYRYVIQEKREIKPSDVSVLDQPVSRRIGTLMTCTPVGTTLRRLILTSQEVDPVTGLALDVGEHRHEEALPKVRMQMLSI